MHNITAVIPAHNCAAFLGEALESVQRQTVPMSEIVVVNDGSTDGTEAVARQFPVRCFPGPGAGSGAARNAGLREARGEWIAFLDGDDTWEPDHVERLWSRLQADPAADLAYTGKQWVDRDGAPLADAPRQNAFPGGWIFRDLLEHNYISTCSAVLARRSALLAAGGFNEAPIFRNGQDYDLWLRVSARGICLGVPGRSVRYRRHSSNRTLDAVARARGHFAAVKGAVEWIRQGQVRPENRPEAVRVRRRMARAYQELADALFYADEFAALRSVGREALLQGHVSPRLLERWALSWLPGGCLGQAKRAVRHWRRRHSLA